MLCYFSSACLQCWGWVGGYLQGNWWDCWYAVPEGPGTPLWATSRPLSSLCPYILNGCKGLWVHLASHLALQSHPRPLTRGSSQNMSHDVRPLHAKRGGGFTRQLCSMTIPAPELDGVSDSQPRWLSQTGPSQASDSLSLWGEARSRHAADPRAVL